MRILVINSGSSSLKYSLIALGPGETVIANANLPLGFDIAGGPATNHAEALETVLRRLAGENDGAPPDAIGHRVVHGGTRIGTTIVDDAVEATIEEFAVFAPAHNPAALAGIRAARRHFPGVVQVAVFDTSFHAGLPELTASYPLPSGLSDGGPPIRRYGFHGINCAWCLDRTSAILGKPADALNLIVAHLGAGASITAIRGGRSVDTSMGMTPLEGLMMQRRSGDLDPAIVVHLARNGMSPNAIEDLLNNRSGVLAVAGRSDMAEVAELAADGDAGAVLARAMYAHRVQKYVGAYAGAVWPLDALVFTGGIGEHDAAMRADICSGLPQLGIDLDADANRSPPSDAARRIDRSGSPAVLVVAANEELQIARETAGLLRSVSQR